MSISKRFKITVGKQEIKPVDIDRLFMTAEWNSEGSLSMDVASSRTIRWGINDLVTVSIRDPLSWWRAALYRLFRRPAPVTVLGRYRVTHITRDWLGLAIDGQDVLSYEMEHQICR